MENETHIDQGEAKADETNEENSEKSHEIPFKKPILVGKIGRLPKKVSVLKKKDSHSQNETENCLDSAQENNDEPPKVETPNLNSESAGGNYKEPTWSGLPRDESKYNFEVLKDGAIIETIHLSGKTHWKFGRLLDCDIPMQHPTISRYHAVLQYRKQGSEKDGEGFYIYDLGSTHGTFLNKRKLRPRIYVRIQVGHLLKLGCSTRTYLLNGPEEDTETESELTVTELKQKRLDDIQKMENMKKEELLRIQKEEEERKKKEEERGIDWGMGEDADEEMDLSVNPFASDLFLDDSKKYVDDPKKTLRGYFEREGLELEYDCSEHGMGQFHCKVELPIDDERGRPVYAEAIHKGKKKDAVIQCALEACRILDRYGLLRQENHESRKRKAKDWAENDYYDSDDDTFLDRTGSVEKKREKRMNAKNPNKAETYESLSEKEQKLSASIKDIERKLREAQEKMNSTKGPKADEDSLDAFMKDLEDSKPDKSTVNKLRSELNKLKKEHGSIIKLVNIARPTSLPPLVAKYDVISSTSTSKSKVLPIFGKRKKIPIPLPKNSSSVKLDSHGDDDDDDEEQEEVEDKDGAGNIPEERIKESTIESSSEAEKGDKAIKSKSSDQSTLGLCEKKLYDVMEKCKLIAARISSNEGANQEKLFRDLVSVVSEGTSKVLQNLENIAKQATVETDMGRLSSITVIPEAGSDNKEISEKNDLKKKKNHRRIQQRSEKAEIEKLKGYEEDSRKEDYNMWVPPQGQKGDGRTELNEKYGY